MVARFSQFCTKITLLLVVKYLSCVVVDVVVAVVAVDVVVAVVVVAVVVAVEEY